MESETIRCACVSDAELISEVLETCIINPFKPLDVLNLLEIINIGVTVTGSNETLVAHASFVDYPDLSENIVKPSLWVEWLSGKLESETYNVFNTLFLQLFISRGHHETYLRKILTEVFSTLPFLEFCAVFCDGTAPVDASIQKLFRLHEISDEDVEFQLWVTQREMFVNRILVRQARAEDTDSVNELMELCTNALRENYGEYFLSDLLDTQGRSTLTVVAEVNGKAVGFMHVTCNVDVGLLNECFELECFYGLRKPHASDEDVPFGVQSSSSRSSSRTKSLQGDQSSFMQRLRSSSMHTRQASCISGSSSRTSLSLRRKFSVQRIENPYHYVRPAKSETEVEITNIEGPAKHSVPYLPLYIEPIVPQYNGESNCFCIHLFSMKEGFEYGCLEMMIAAFEKFSHLEYCVILMPYTSPEFSLLHYFVRVPGRPLSLFPQALFLFHKAALLPDFHVRFSEEKDLAGVRNLVSSLWWTEYLNIDMKYFIRAIKKDEKKRGKMTLQAFVAIRQGQVVGAAVLRDEDDLNYICSHFAVDDFILWKRHGLERHGRLIHCVLNPAFKLMSKLFLKEVMRLSGKFFLYYPVYPAHATYNESLWQSVFTSLEDLVPLKCRRLIQYSLDELHGLKPAESVLRTSDNCCMYHFNRKLTLTRKFTVDARIVVVGASEVALGFLEYLIFQSDHQFTNLTLVSPHGIPGELPPDELRNAFLPFSVDYNQDVLDKICLHAWVNVVYGTMTEIDRNVKVIQINGETEVPYDYLVLSCGLQFQKPTRNLSSSSANGTPLRKTSSLEMRIGNVFAINDSYEASIALNWLGEHYLTSKGHVVVYGNCLEAYICIHGLMNAGAMNLKIVFVKSPDDSERTVFRTKEIEDGMVQIMKSHDVTIFNDYELELLDDKSTVNSVLIHSPEKQRTLKCIALFMCKDKKVHFLTFKAVKNADLVFDGRLVIDASFRTNDPFIYGAGTFTRLSNRYFAHHMDGVQFNSKEVGCVLASKIMKLFHQDENEPIQHGEFEELPVYKEPINTCAKLPCGWNYLCVDKPRYKYPSRSDKLENEKPMILSSGNFDADGPGYILLEFNQFCEVETITCFSREEIQAGNLLQLYGLHYSFLNKIFERFKKREMTNVLEFLKEPWSLILYHDCFRKFRDDVRALAYVRKDKDLLSIAEKTALNLRKNPVLNDQQRQELKKAFEDLGYKDDIQKLFRYFLSYYSSELPMYSQSFQESVRKKLILG